MTTIFKVHSDDPKKVVEYLHRVIEAIERDNRIFSGEIFDPLNALMGRDTTLVEIRKEKNDNA
jgi:hypothetical protein